MRPSDLFGFAALGPAPALGLVLLLAATVAAQTPDTSEWKCEFCPFEDGARADYSVGASVVSDDAARYGNGTGYDEEGVYARIDGDGAYTGESLRLDWLVEDLGVDSRRAEIALARPGRFNIRASYRARPYRLFDSTSTVYAETPGNSLSLPAGWTPAGLTSTLPDLGANLERRDIESDRDIFEFGAGVRPGSRFRLFADYRRQEQDGVSILAGSWFTNSSLLPRPFDYTTDELDLGLRFDGQRAHAALSLYGSLFQNKGTALYWDNPFLSLAGAERGALAQPPDSSFRQLALKAGYAVDRATHLAVSAAIGRIEQDDRLLAYTVNPTLTAGALPRARLDGEVDTTNLSVTLSSRASSKIDLRVGYRYDERDNRTPRETWSRVIVDSLASGEAEINTPYSFERSRLSASADVTLLSALRVGAGYERTETDRDFQEVAEQSEDKGWGRLRWQPNAWIDISAKGGTAKREIDRYDTQLAQTLGQNPLLRKYHLAHRYREFGELALSASFPGTAVAVSTLMRVANDDYSKSVLGLLSSDELGYSADLSWALSDEALVYVSAGLEEIDAEQAGSAAFGAPDWIASHEDEFRNFGVGLRFDNVTERLDLAFDYAIGRGSGEIEILSGDPGAGAFPDLESNLDTLRATATYRQSDRLHWLVDLRYESFETEEWALQDVAPATLPTILTLGASPYDYDIVQFGLSFRYRFGENAGGTD